MTTDELVSVPVPRKYLTSVYSHIAQLENGTFTATAAPEGAAAINAADEDWTPACLRKFVERSSPAMKEILCALAENPAKWLTTAQLAASMKNNPNANWQTVAGTLGAAGRRRNNRLHIDRSPYDHKYDHEERGNVYRMSIEIAKQVLRILRNGDE